MARAGRARRGGRGDRDRRRRHRIGDRGEQGSRHSRGDVRQRDPRALLAGAQRCQRAGARLDAGEPDEARGIVDTFIGTPMREPRYIRRLAKIRDLEDGDAAVMEPVDLQRLDPDRRRGAGVRAEAAPLRSAARCHSAAVRTAARTGCRASSDAGASRIGAARVRRRRPAASPAMIDHTLLKPDATRARDRNAVPGGGAVRVRQRLREPDVGGALRAAAARQPA